MGIEHNFQTIKCSCYNCVRASRPVPLPLRPYQSPLMPTPPYVWPQPNTGPVTPPLTRPFIPTPTASFAPPPGAPQAPMTFLGNPPPRMPYPAFQPIPHLPPIHPIPPIPRVPAFVPPPPPPPPPVLRVPTPEPNVSRSPAIHLGITCDVCNRTVVGIRHKCLDCPGKVIAAAAV
jgi:hypothetical protein